MVKMKLNTFKQGRQKKTNWRAKPFFKTGFMVLNGPVSVGKTSLCANLALANRQAKELWPGGPKGDGRGSLFFSGGIIEAEHISDKLRAKEGIKIVESIQVKNKILFSDPVMGVCSKMNLKAPKNYSPVKKYLEQNYNTSLLLHRLLEVVKPYNPAFVFFDFKISIHRDRLKNIKKAVSEFMAEVKNTNTTFLGLVKKTSAPLIELKRLPRLDIIKKGTERFLVKRAGFSDLPNGVLRFKIEHKADRFLACDFKYLENLNQAENSRESQEAHFREILAQLTAKGQAITTAELKAKARKAGISTYFLAKPHWADYGLQTIGEGFGGNYRQVLKPIEKH